MASPAKLRWRDALALKIREEVSAAVVSSYQLGVMLYELAVEREYAGRHVVMRSKPVDRAMFMAARRTMITRQVLQEDPRLPNTVLRVPGRKDTDPTTLLCQIDPFGHVAYLSAMAHHGLTNRLPRVLYFRTLDPPAWAAAARERMAKDLGEHLPPYNACELPSLRHTKITKLGPLVVETVRSKNAGFGWRHIGEEGLRVTTLARTFLDMLQRPELCGGIRHVIELFEEHAKTYLSVIVPEIMNHGGKIDQARAGYILEEKCRLSHPMIDEWAKEAIRGGSRRLDPQAEYVPTFSERWCLSINV